MTITSLPLSVTPSLGNSTLDMAVLAKSLDSAEISGQQMVKMMEQSVNPNLGTNIDMLV
ncbi:MAG: YjfB family protein [Herbinix sp.]|nr:YjfB family protein [Herbinix sp.]